MLAGHSDRAPSAAALAPMPSASAVVAASVNQRSLIRRRVAKRTSCQRSVGMSWVTWNNVRGRRKVPVRFARASTAGEALDGLDRQQSGRMLRPSQPVATGC